jgi:hypothetical protein
MAEIIKLGEPRPAPGSKRPPTPTGENDRSRIILIAACAVVVLLVLCGGIYLMMGGATPPADAGASVRSPAAVGSPSTVASPSTGGGTSGAATAPMASPGVTGAGGSGMVPASGVSSGHSTGSVPPAPIMSPGASGVGGVVAQPGASGQLGARKPSDDDPYAGGPHDR